MNKQLIDQLISLFQIQKFGFVSIKNYTNSKGEISSRRINIGFKFENLKHNDLKILNEGVEFIPHSKYSIFDWNIAIEELKQSIIKPEKERSKAQSEAYIKISDNGALKYNINTNKLYIIGLELKNSKTIIEEGEYTEVESKAKTIAKQVIKKHYLKSGLIRNFIVEQIGEIRINGEELEIY